MYYPGRHSKRPCRGADRTFTWPQIGGSVKLCSNHNAKSILATASHDLDQKLAENDSSCGSGDNSGLKQQSLMRACRTAYGEQLQSRHSVKEMVEIWGGQISSRRIE